MVNSGSFDEHGSEGELVKAEFTKLEEETTVTVPRTAESPHHLVGACATEANFTAVVPDGETRCSSHDTSKSSTLETEKEEHHQDLSIPERDDGLKETITSYLDLKLVAEKTQTTIDLPEGSNAKSSEVVTKTSLQCSVPLDKVKNVLELYKRNSDKTNFFILESYLMQNIKPSEPMTPELTTNTAEIVELNSDSSSQKPAMKRLLCLFCERTFTSNNLRQKHVDRCHSVGQSRRSSSRIPNQNQSATACCFCSKLNHTDHTLKQLLEHLINEHSNRYFACLACQERFANLHSLREHNRLVHGIILQQETDYHHKLPATSVTNCTVSRDSESVRPCTQTELNRTVVSDLIAKSDSTQSSSTHVNSSLNILTKSKRNTTIKNTTTPPETSKNETILLQHEGVDFEENILANVISSESIKKNIEVESELEDLNLSTRRAKTTVTAMNLDKKNSSKKPTVINKKLSVKSTKIGVRSNLRTTRATVKQMNTFTKNRNKSKLVQSDSGGAQIVATKKLVANPTSVFSLVNAYTYKFEKIYDHSSDSIKDSNSVAFNAVFDKEFYTRTVCNIRDNLLHHLDGKLNSNVESESRISNFEHNPTCVPDTDVRTINDALDNFGCDLSLNAVTPVATLLASSQYGEDFDSQIEYGAKASQKKAKKAAVVKYKFTNKKYNSLFREKDCHTDLTYLDMWTQFTVKNSQHKCHDCEPFDQHSILPIYSLNPIAKDQVDELNRIMDKRGPFEDLRLEADAAQRFELRKKSKETDSSSSDESSKEICFILEELLTQVEHKCNDVLKMEKTDPDSESFLDNLMLRRVESKPKEEVDQNTDIPDYLQLQRTLSTPDFIPIDETDKIALICSSLDDNSVPVNKALELSGEWTRPRIYICATCGLKLPNLKALDDHKNFDHPNIWGTHYEFVGNQAKLYRHLSIPGLGKVGLVECSPTNKFWQRSDARVCTKCTKQCHSLGDLHRHMLECGGDWTWMLARKKCKYRPYGARSRRRRQRGYKRSCNPEIPREPRKYKTKNNFIGPRPKPTKPSDAETIERMLANLPPKRNRKAISMRDGIQKPRKPYKQRLVSQTTPNNPQSDPPPSVSPKKVHFKINSPQITTKQTLRNVIKQKISVLKKPNIISKTEHLDTPLKLRSRLNKKDESEIKINVNKDETEQIIGKNKIRQSRMISRILGSKIFDTNSAIVTRRRLVKAITQNNLIRKTRLRSKNVETNAQLSSNQKIDEQSAEENVEKLTIDKNKNTSPDNIRKGRNRLGKQQNTEESEKILIPDTVSVKASEPENKILKRSSSKRFMSVLTKTNNNNNKTKEDKKEAASEKKMDTISVVINDVVKMSDIVVGNTSDIKNIEMATDNKRSIRKTRSLDRINRIDETQEDNLKGESIKIVDDIVKNNKKSNNVGKIFGRKTNKLVQNLKSLNRRNKLKSLENENKDNKSIASKLLRTFSIRDSKNKKTVKMNELKEEANAINDTKVESVNNVDSIISSVIENIPITVQEIKSSKVVETSTMPILEKFDSTSNIPTDTIPDLSPITEIETNIKLDEIHQNDVISDPEKTNTDAADLNINDNDKNKLLNKFKSKIKRSGRGLNDCIAMLRGKLEQKCQNTDPSFVDKSSLFILNSSEMIKHSQLIEAEQNESVLSNSVESITDIPVTVKEMNKLCDKITDADNSIEIMENIDSPIKNNKSEKCTKISNAETPTLNINVNVLEIPTVKCHGNSITNNVTTNKLHESNNGYITPNMQLSYVLNATLKNCLMECVKNKCEELKIESQNVTLEKLNRINKDRKIGSIRKRAKKKNNTNLVEKHIVNVNNTSEIEKAVTNVHNNINVTEKHIPNVPVLLNTAFVETPVELNKTDIPITKQLMDESSDEDVPLSKLIGSATTLPSTKLNVQLPAAKKKRKQKKKIAFTPLILNNQDTCVSQVNLQENVTLDYSKHNQIGQIQDDIEILKDNNFEETSEDTCEEEFLSNNEIYEEEIQSKGENKIEENLEKIESIKPDEDKIIISDEEPLANYLVADEQMYAKEASLEQTEIDENFERIESNRPDNVEKVHVCEEDPLLNSNISEDSIKGTSLYMLVFPRSNNQFKEVAINKKTEISTENKIDTISTVINEVVKMFSIEEEPPLEEIATQVVKLVEIKKLWEGQEHLNKEILREIEIEDAVVEAPKILVEEATSSVISPIHQEKEESQESTSVTKNLIKDIIEVFNPLSHHIMTVEDEPCDVHLLNKTLTEANIKPTITVKIVENSEILNKTTHVDSGKENSEEKSLYQRIKKQRKTAKKNKNKRKPRSVKIISQIENVKPSNSRSEDNLDESCIISSDNTSEKINDEHVIHFKCNLQFEAEPDSIVMENKEIIGTSLKENLEMKPLEHSILSSDSEDELPLALLIKQRNQNVDLELIKDSHEFRENEISVKIDNEHSESATTVSKTDCFNNIESVDLIVPSIEKPVDLFETDLNEFDDIVQDNSVIIKSLSEENLSLNVEEILTRIDEDSKDICNLHCLEENILQVAEDPIVNLSNIKTLEVDVIKDTLNLENTTGLNADFEVSTEVNEDLQQFSKPGIAEILEDQDETFKGNIRVENITYQETLMKTPVATQKSNEDPFNFLKTPIDTPVLINNTDFITTPDLADPLLVINIEKKLKVKYRKSKKSRKRVIPKSSNKNNIRRKEEDLNTIHICDICNKIFKRKETLTSHKRTLTHIAKLSEIEAWESSAKRSAEANNDIQSIQESSTDLNNKEVELLEETNLNTIDETPEDNIELNDIEVTSTEKNIHNSEGLTEEIIHNSEPAVEEIIHKPEHAIEEFKNDNESSEVIKIQKSESLQIEIDIPNYPETCIDEYKIHESKTVKIETEIQDGLEISNENDVLFMEDIKQHAIELPDLIIDDENSIDSDQHLGSENLVIDEEEDIEEIVMNSVPSFVPGIIVNSTNRNLKLVDIINEVLDKPVMDLSIRKIEYQPNKSPKRNDSVDKYAEPKRYKSVGERKSFDSDNVSLPQKSDDETPVVDNYNPINLVVNNGILSKQLSILENIMEDPSKINYIDDSISISSREFDEPLVEQTMPDKDIFRSVESMTILKDPTIKFSHNSDVLNSFIKPNFTNFQNISETINKSITHQYEEVSQVNFEEQPEIKKARKENSTRKILNRDEELFLECCSLLKSSSEITGMSKKSTKHIPLNNFSQSNDTNWMQKQAVSNRYIQRDSYSWLAQSSRVNTPIGEPFVNNDWSNSNSAVSSEWMAQKAQSPDRPTENNTFLKKCNNNSGEIKYSDIQFEDISVDSSMEASKTLMAADSSNTENIPLDFHNVDFFESNRNKDINTDDEDASYLEIALDEDSENVSYKTDENEFTTEKDHLVDEQELEIEEKFDVDLKKKVITAFGGLMARAMGNRLHAAVKKNKRSRSKRESNSQQSSIIDYTVPLKKNKLEPVDSDSSDGPKKVITKGAMKVFEGIKVSIPTQDLNLQEVLNVAKKLEVNEIESKSEQIKLNYMEEFQSNTIKEKSQNHKNGKLKKLFGRFGNKLGLRATKKKQSKHRSSAKAQSTIDKSHDVYDFEESCDNFTFKNGTFPLFRSSRDNTSEKSESDCSAPKCTINKKNGAKSTLENDNIVESLKWNIESDSDTDRYYDSMSFEEVSVSSDTTRGCSTLNDKIKPMVKRNSEKSKDNQKKCMIMGRIFKNASKPKLEDKIPEIRDFSSEDNSKLVEPFLDSCSSIDNVDTNVPLLPSPNNLTVINSANKMSKIEMDLLFDKLLESEKKNSEAQLAAKINKEAVDAIATDESHVEKNKKCKDVKAKSSKSKKRHRHNSGESRSSDEYTLYGRHTKSSKKHHKTPRKPSKPKKESGFNLEQEMKECIGVAGRKSQRKCTSGKQNVLIESWSSDESSFEDEIPQVVTEPEMIPEDQQQNIEEDSNTDQIDTLSNSCNSVTLEMCKPVVSEEKNLNFDVYEFDSDMETKNVDLPKTIDAQEFINVNKIKIPRRSIKSKIARSRKHSKTHLALNEIEFESEKSKKRAEHRRRRMLEHGMSESNITDSLAVTRKKRNASDMLYYWSSSSDDEFQDLIEVKPIREDTDDDRPMQHGWIVGESPKKLVTLLAQAKGKKIDGESVKEQGKKNRVTL